MIHHIGSDNRAPFAHRWRTDWVPDQNEPIQISARIQDDAGIIAFIEPVTELILDRTEVSVELCKPYQIPQKWVTRSGEKSEKVDIIGSMDQAVEYQLCWASWSPGYMNGLYVNGQKVFDKEGPLYQYYAHRVTVKDVSALKKGVNIIKTGKTPLHNGQMVHGMEVEWPGIMLLVKYDKTIDSSLDNRFESSSDFTLVNNYPNPFNPSTTIEYNVDNDCRVTLTIRNSNGRLVKTLIDERQTSGKKSVEWNGFNKHGKSVASGLYFAELKTPFWSAIHKLVLVR